LKVKEKVLKEKYWDEKTKKEKEREQRYIICLNSQEAKEDAKKREYFKRILEKKVAYSSVKEWIVKNGYRKYLKIEGEDIQINIDEKRLEREKIFDGKWVLSTNTKYSHQEVAKYYKSLAQVERGFRDLKSEIEVGPMYHWTEKRIRAHIFICFLALILKITFTKKLEVLDKGLSYSQVIEDVKAVKANEIMANGKEVVFRTDLEKFSHLGFQAVGVKTPGDLIAGIVS